MAVLRGGEPRQDHRWSALRFGILAGAERALDRELSYRKICEEDFQKRGIYSRETDMRVSGIRQCVIAKTSVGGVL